MAKAKKRYFVLGKKASVFYDPFTGLKVTSQLKPASLEKPLSKRVQLALDNKHIIQVESGDEIEVENKSQENESKGPKLTAEAILGMDAETLDKNHTKKDFIEYYKENWEVDEDDIAKFSKMTNAKMIAFLKDEEEDEE